MEEGLPLGIEARPPMRRPRAPHGIAGFHEAFPLGEHAPRIGGRRRRDADRERSVVIGLDLGFHAFVLHEGGTKVRI